MTQKCENCGGEFEFNEFEREEGEKYCPFCGETFLFNWEKELREQLPKVVVQGTMMISRSEKSEEVDEFLEQD